MNKIRHLKKYNLRIISIIFCFLGIKDFELNSAIPKKAALIRKRIIESNLRTLFIPRFLIYRLFAFFITLTLYFNTTAQDYFTWDNSTVYFLLTDRFFDGDASNNFPYGRTADPIGGFQGGDLKGLTQKINEGYFDDLGVDAIWFTAPYEQIHGAVPGYWNGYPNDDHYAYHGYYTLDFTEVDANMGTVADMQAFVDAAHAKGIRVVMDIVVNHVGYETLADANEFNLGEMGDPWQDPNTGLNPNDPDWCNWWTDSNGNSWLRKGDTSTDYCSEACGGSDLELCLAGLPDIRTELTSAVGLPEILQTKWDATKEAQEISELNTFFNNTGLTPTPANHIIKWLTDWVRDYGIDGFRIDTYKHVEREIWGELKMQAQTAFDDWKVANPSKVLDDNDFWMVGEWFGHGPNKNAEAVNPGKTDALINFNFQGIAGDPSALESTYSSYANIAADPEWNFLSYISSHDTDLFDRNDLMDAATSLLLSPGAVQIFYGDETKRLPLNTGTDQDTRSVMNWGSFDSNLRSHWSKVGEFRQAHPAIGAGAHQQLDDSPYTFMRDYINASDGLCDKIVAAVGLTPNARVTLDVGGAFADGELIRDAYTGNTTTVSGGQLTLTIGSGGVALLEYVNDPVCIAVDISPDVCYSATPLQITIDATDASAPMSSPTIYYTFDETATTADLSDWIIYTMPFTLSQSEIVFAFARNVNGEDSEIVSQNYTIGGGGTMTVRWKPTGCTTPYVYAWEMDGVMDSELAPWPGVAMNGPDANGWYEYTINAAFSNLIFSCNGANQSDDLFACGDICYDNGFVDCPSFDPTVSIAPTSSNHPSGSVDVSITSSEGACSIYYTTDGSTPTTSSTLYSGTFTLNGTAGNPITVKAIGDCGGMLTVVDEETYTFDMVSTMTLYWNAAAVGCTTPYLYAWNLDGQANTEVAAWPGVPMTDSDGDGWYEYTLNASTAEVIFSCNSANQTDDLMASGDSCYDNGWVSCSPSVNISPVSSNHSSGSVDVSMNAGPGACTIYYTTDGSTPTTSSTLYVGTFTLNGIAGNPVTVKAIADCGGMTTSVAEETYTFDVSNTITMYWNPEGSCSTPYLYAFALDGVGGTENAPFPGEPMVDSDGDGWYEYTINASSSMVIFNCMGGGTNNQTVDLSVNGDACFQGKANQNMDAGMFVACPNFDAPEVFIEPIGGNYTDGSVTVSLSANNATDIYYTTDGSTPDNTSTSYTNPFPLNSSMSASINVQAIAYNGVDASDVKMETYTFSQQADDRPIILCWDPQGSCGTPFIYVWELDGAAGTENAPFPGEAMTDEDSDGWYEYTVDAASTNVIFSCGSNQNQTADLFAEGHACFQGNVGNGNWVSCPDFNEPSVAIHPNGGMFAGGSNVAVTLPSAEASNVYYTLDGSTPDVMSTPYTGVFNVTGTNETIMVKAIAYSSTNSSAVVSADFVFDNTVSCPDSIGVHGMIGGGTYRAANKITSTATTNTGNVIFEAGTSVTLKDGFHADPASSMDQFTARIQSCASANEEVLEEREGIILEEKTQLQVFPNPFSGSTTIRYFLPTESPVQLHVLDINGRVLKYRNMPSTAIGWQEYVLDAQHLVKGIYFLNLATASEVITRKIVVVD